MASLGSLLWISLAEIKVLARAAISSGTWALLPSPLFVGRIQFLEVVGLQTSASRGRLLRDSPAGFEEISCHVVMGHVAGT